MTSPDPRLAAIAQALSDAVLREIVIAASPAAWLAQVGRYEYEVAATDCAAMRAVLLAALSPVLAERTWQPIASAPKDGTKVLLAKRPPQPGYVHVDGDVVIGWWYGSWNGIQSQYWTSRGADRLDPIAWHVLPLPPAGEPQR